MTVYDVTLRTLTPLHIGDGDELKQDFDFVAREGRTYRLDEDAILRAKESEAQPGPDGNYPPPGRLLAAADFQNASLFRYALAGMPRSARTDARVRSFIKDAHDRPYVPGSSLKGALRTALAWNGWLEVKPGLDRAAVGRSRAWAAQPLERKLFGPNPNHDLLRALHVSDLAGPARAGEGLMLVNAQVLTKRSAGSPVELEALKSDATLRGTLTIDETLFSAQAERELRFGNRRHWLDELLPRAQRHSLARIEVLAEWYEEADGCEAIAAFYRRLAGARVGAGTALLQIGWGAGWDAKTFWTHLQSDSLLFEQLVRDFRLHKAARGSPPRQAGDPFPRSKRAAMSGQKPAAPLGWVLIEVRRPGEPEAEAGAAPRAAPVAAPAPAKAKAPAVKPAAASPPPRPAPPAKAKPAQQTAPLIASFTEVPKVGDRFRGTVFDVLGDGTIYLEIPGLSSDDTAYAVIGPEGNPDKRKYPDRMRMTCEVIEVKPDPQQPQVMRVVCRRQ